MNNNTKLLFTLISVRFKGMIRGMANSAAKENSGKKKRNKKGIFVLFAFLMLYLLLMVEIMLVFAFHTLSALCTPEVGLANLYFALAGLLAVAMVVILNVFSTQNQLYNASDNELLLAMPIPPGFILLSRMVTLLLSALGICLLVLAPAAGVYLWEIGPLLPVQWVGIFCFLLSAVLFGQILACALGYLLHLFLSKMKNTAIASVLYMVIFLAVYFYCYSKMGTFLTYLATSGGEVAGAIRTWAAPFWLLGKACAGEGILPGLSVLLGVCALFALLYVLLSRTFVRSIQRGQRSSAAPKSKGKRAIGDKLYTQHSPSQAVFHKETRKFLTCGIYLTNSGVGLIMTLVGAVAAILFREKLLTALAVFGNLQAYYPIAIAGVLCMMSGMAIISAPSISLEGASLWILRSMPISGRDILTGKLRLHVRLVGIVNGFAAVVLCAVFGCPIVESVFVLLLAEEFALLTGVLGLIFNLLFPNFKWLNEATPCKQGGAVTLSMFSGFGILLVGLLLYLILGAVFSPLSPLLYIIAATIFYGLASFFLCRLLFTWGARRFSSFPC